MEIGFYFHPKLINLSKRYRITVNAMEIQIMKQAVFTVEILLVLFVVAGFFSCSKKISYTEMIAKGDFQEARKLIKQDLSMNDYLSPNLRQHLEMLLVKMDRIEKDFTLTESEVIEYVKKYYPELTNQDLRRWEKEHSLEYKIIDGEKRYFNYAQYNLFRLDSSLKAIKQKLDKERGEGKKAKEFPLDEHISSIIREVEKTGNNYVKPVKMKIKQSLTVKENMVPEGRIIRCWIPFPREIENRQTDIQILATEPADYRLADNSNLQRTIYFEKPSNGTETTEFFVEYTFMSRGVYVSIDPEKVVPVKNKKELLPYIKERRPHIEFSDTLRELSKSIVGNEKNPYLIARKLYAWVDTNITWASAREYSTFFNIPKYVIENRHGDCGMQTLTFMTLCRLNGIPCKWQSGWEFQPPDDSMHDWGEIYFEPYGWVPMDVTYGMRKTGDEQLKWFYLSGMDSYRLIFNDDYSRCFSPEKKFVRSETIDSQRGEAEWDEGNLYFDQWRWDLEWELLE